MSEEFGFQAEFQCEDEQAIELLKSIGKCFDEENYSEIESLLSKSDMDFESENIKVLIDSSYYGTNLAKALSEHADQCHAELGIPGNFGMQYLHELKKDSDGKYLFVAEGTDREADEFCKYLSIFLHAIGVTNLKATAGASYWSGAWSNEGGSFTAKFKEIEC